MAILVPTSCQEVPNFTPRSAKRAQFVAKICQNTPKSLKPDPSRPQNVAKTQYCCSFLHFGRFSKDRSQDHQKCSRWLPKWPQHGHLGSYLEDLGAILALSWRHLGPFGRDFGRSEPGQNSPKSAKTDFQRIFVPRSLPRPPRPPPSLDFSNFGIYFLYLLFYFLDDFFIDSTFNFDGVLTFFLQTSSVAHF